MDQCGGLQRVILPLVLKIVLRDAAQLAINPLKQRIDCLLVAGACLQKQLGHACLGSISHRITFQIWLRKLSRLPAHASRQTLKISGKVNNQECGLYPLPGHLLTRAYSQFQLISILTSDNWKDSVRKYALIGRGRMQSKTKTAEALSLISRAGQRPRRRAHQHMSRDQLRTARL